MIKLKIFFSETSGFCETGLCWIFCAYIKDVWKNDIEKLIKERLINKEKVKGANGNGLMAKRGGNCYAGRGERSMLLDFYPYFIPTG